MNRETLLAFMQRILENGSGQKTILSLGQLRDILQTQNADREMIRLVEETLRSVPEAREAVREKTLTEEALQIAFRRADDRRRREAEAERQGRC